MRKPTFKSGVAFMQTFKLLPHDSVMLLQPVLVKNFGKSGALLLSQLHYWLSKDNSLGCNYQGNRWIYNTAEEWGEQLQLSARYVRQLFAKFTNLGIVKVAKLHKIKSVRTNYYSIDYNILNDLIRKAENFDSHEEQSSFPLGKNNLMYNDTKTTTKDFNKSETKLKSLKGQESGSEKKQVKQVELVKNKNSKIKKEMTSKEENKNISFRDANVEKNPLKTSITQDMLKIWNTILGEKSLATMSKDLAPYLVYAFSTKFGREMRQWQRYCELIKTSDYLMQERFDLSILWALKFSTIDRLRAGGLGVKPKYLTTEVVIDEAQIDELITALDESDEVKTLRRTIVQAVGAANYRSWFHQASFVKKEEKILLIAPNSFVESKWEELFPWINKEKAA